MMDGRMMAGLEKRACQPLGRSRGCIILPIIILSLRSATPPRKTSPIDFRKLDLLTKQPELARRYEGLFGKEYIEVLRRQDRAMAIQEAEAFYDRANKDYGDVKLPYNETLEALLQEVF